MRSRSRSASPHEKKNNQSLSTERYSKHSSQRKDLDCSKSIEARHGASRNSSCKTNQRAAKSPTNKKKEDRYTTRQRSVSPRPRKTRCQRRSRSRSEFRENYPGKVNRQRLKHRRAHDSSTNDIPERKSSIGRYRSRRQRIRASQSRGRSLVPTFPSKPGCDTTDAKQVELSFLIDLAKKISDRILELENSPKPVGDLYATRDNQPNWAQNYQGNYYNNNTGYYGTGYYPNSQQPYAYGNYPSLNST